MRRKALTALIKIYLLSLILPINNAGDNTTRGKNYFALITNVHKYFGTSCIFVVHSRQERNEEIHRIQQVLRQFSAQRIFSISVEFGRLREAMRFYSHRIVKSLIVVSLRTHEIVATFSNLTNHFDMHTSYWLLLFDDQIYLENYNSIKPGRNIFSLTFNTEMLVARTDSSIVQEWYWLRNRIKMEDLAFWDFGTGFTLKTDESLYERRTNLEEAPIFVTTMNNPPMTSFSNNTMGGLFGKIFEELSRVANCNVEFVPPHEVSYGSWDSKKNRWTGMMDMLVSGKASIAAADFTITTLRLESVDFSLPLISAGDKLYIRKPENGICWSTYWKALASEIWILIQVCILITTIVLTLITAVRKYKITTEIVIGYLLHVFGAYCQQGLADFPNDLPSRIAYFSIFLSALIISAAYGAALTSFLTVTGINLPFNSIEEFVEDGTYKLLVYRDGAEYDMFSTATDPILVGMWNLIDDRSSLPITLKSAFERVCKEKVAFYVPAPLEESIQNIAPCKVIGIETKRTMSLAMALSKGNPYNGLINFHVQRFRDYGILYRLKYKFAAGSLPSPSKHVEVALWGILPILAVLGGGILSSIFILFAERFIFNNKQFRESTKKKSTQKFTTNIRGRETMKIPLRNRGNYNSINFHP